MTDNIQATLAERGKTYGSFIEQSEISQALLAVMMNTPNWHPQSEVDDAGWRPIPPHMREALSIISVKIARILNGDPYHYDSWHDIAGYATLIANTLGP
jgi:hypothetical protein